MVNDADHTHCLRVIFAFYRLIDFTKAECLERVFLAFRFVNRAFYQRDFYLAHVLIFFKVYGYPLNNFSSEIPRMRATSTGLRRLRRASMVAFTTLCGLDEPWDLANTS